MKVVKLSELTGNKRGRDYKVDEAGGRMVIPANDPSVPDFKTERKIHGQPEGHTFRIS